MELDKTEKELIKFIYFSIPLAILMIYICYLFTIEKCNVYINGKLIYKEKKVSIDSGTVSFEDVESTNFTKIGKDIFITK